MSSGVSPPHGGGRARRLGSFPTATRVPPRRSQAHHCPHRAARPRHGSHPYCHRAFTHQLLLSCLKSSAGSRTHHEGLCDAGTIDIRGCGPARGSADPGPGSISVTRCSGTVMACHARPPPSRRPAPSCCRQPCAGALARFQDRSKPVHTELRRVTSVLPDSKSVLMCWAPRSAALDATA
jgi:hypothetical protein